MLQPDLTRIELKAEDREEVRTYPLGACRLDLTSKSSLKHCPFMQYVAVRKQQREAQLQELAERTGQLPLTPLLSVSRTLEAWLFPNVPGRALQCPRSYGIVSFSNLQTKKASTAQRLGLAK